MYELDEDSIITLTDDQGNDIDFLLLDVVEYNEKDYMVLLPLADDEGSEEDEVLILQVDKEEEGEIYQSVEDETTLQAVLDLFEKSLPVEEDEDAPGEN
ncbi:MAG: DUF1292 domain-containing protein [Clostridia bacterium]|nr:DUF1292 domain-containing protein [Clostridia bacterium]